MRAIKLFTLLIIGIAALCGPDRAHSDELLDGMVRKLIREPDNDSLREGLISHALRTKPTIPPQALAHEQEGRKRQATAKTQQGWLDVRQSYLQALDSAPWLAGYYFALGEADEKLGDLALAELKADWHKEPSCNLDDSHVAVSFRQSKKWFRFYQVASPLMDELEAAGIEQRMAERDFDLAQWRHEVKSACCLGCGGLPPRQGGKR